ncbi:hypothetical protein DSECCO2_523210 [anaerobic digester metagenome]
MDACQDESGEGAHIEAPGSLIVGHDSAEGMHDVIADLGFVAHFNVDAFNPPDPQSQGLFVLSGFVTVDRQVEDPGLDDDNVLAHPGLIASANVDTRCRRHGQLACVGDGERVSNVVPENLGFRRIVGYDAGGLRTDFSFVGLADAGGLYLDLVIENLPLLGLGDHDAYRQDDPGLGDNLDRVVLDECVLAVAEDTDRPGCVESHSDDRDVILQDLQALRVAGPDTPGLNGRVVQIRLVRGAGAHGYDPVVLDDDISTPDDQNPEGLYRRSGVLSSEGWVIFFFKVRCDTNRNGVHPYCCRFTVLRDRHDVVVVDAGIGHLIDRDARLSAAPDGTHLVAVYADIHADLNQDTIGDRIDLLEDRDVVVDDLDRFNTMGIDPDPGSVFDLKPRERDLICGDLDTGMRTHGVEGHPIKARAFKV